MTEDSPIQATQGSEVFVSYASQDTAVANAIVEALERNGLRCWIAPRDVRAGAHYADAIVRAIGGAKVFVLVLSANAGASSHVGKEVERASSKKRPIIALRIDAAPLTPALEYFLSESQWIEAQAAMMEAAYAKLIDAIRAPDRTAPNGIPAVAPEASVRRATALHTKSRRNQILLLAGLAVVAVTLAALWANFRPAQQVTAEEPTTAAETAVSDKSIAVLPFVNMSSDKEQEYFSDGLSEELLNLLAKLPELRVIGRTSSFQFKGRNEDLRVIGEKLNVAHILEGSVRKSGEKVRITAQLIRASDGYHQWSETYDRTLDDIFAVQDEIAAAVVSQLKITLLSKPPTVLTTNPEAYAFYLQALQLDRQGTGRFDESIALYEKVLALDPNYTPAWFGLGANYAGQANMGDRPLVQGMEQARKMLGKALAIDSEYGLAHAGLGWLALAYDHDLAAAARHFERALALNPTDPYTLGLASSLNEALGRLDTDVSVGEYLVSRDPMDPSHHANLGYVYLNAGRLDESIASSRNALKLSPDMLGIHALIGDALWLKRDYEAALTEYEIEPGPAARLGGLAATHYAQGNKSESDAALDELIEKYADWANLIAVVFAQRGETGRAFEWLHKAVANRDSGLTHAPTSVWLRNLHDDPRWLPFLRKIGKAPEQLAAIKFELKVPEH